MFCSQCGKENPDGTKICKHCGQEIIITGSNRSDVQASQTDPTLQTIQTPQVAQKANPKIDFKNIDKAKLKKYGIIGGGALVVIILAIIIIASATSKVSIKKYAADELEFSGINGYGTVKIGDLIDYDALNNDIKKKNKKPSAISSLLGDSYDWYYSDARDYITYECTSENNGTLSNGDKVIITVKIDQDRMKSDPGFSKKISGGDEVELKYEVSGLEDGTAIDVFDAVESVVIDTTSGYNSVSINLKKDYRKDYGTGGINVQTDSSYIKVYGDDFRSFTVSVSTVTDNIDKNTKSVKLITSSDASSYVEYGIALAPTEKEFTPKIISNVDSVDFSKEDLASLNKRMKAYAAESFNGETYKLEKEMLFHQEQTGQSFIAYFYKLKDNKYAVTFYNYVKQDQNGRIYKIDDLKTEIEGFWGYNKYDSINDYVKQNTGCKTYDLPLT